MAVTPVWQDPITGKTGFTALSTDTLPNAVAGSVVYITDQAGSVYTNVGGSWAQTTTKGSDHVRPINGTGEVDKNRNINAAATTYAESTNSCAWDSTDNVTEFWVECTAAAATSADSILMAIDSPSAAAAAAFFADTGGRAVDVEYRRIPYNQRIGPFTGVSYFTSLEFLPTIASTKITVEAQ